MAFFSGIVDALSGIDVNVLLTLIDLTDDTVTADTLFKGCTAHRADGTIITGILFEGFPEEQPLYDILQDLNGNSIEDGSGNEVKGKTVYRRV